MPASAWLVSLERKADCTHAVQLHFFGSSEATKTDLLRSQKNLHFPMQH